MCALFFVCVCVFVFVVVFVVGCVLVADFCLFGFWLGVFFCVCFVLFTFSRNIVCVVCAWSAVCVCEACVPGACVCVCLFCLFLVLFC